MKIHETLLAIALAAACLAPPAAAQDAETGLAAWEAGRDDEAVRAWLPLAEAGNAQAQYRLGDAYRLGRGVPPNLQQAESWYRRAAEQGHEEAQTLLGLIMLHNGRRREAMPLIEQAAERGDARAQYVLATALFHGDFIAPDRPRGFAMMARSAAQGLAAAAEDLPAMEARLTAEERARAAALAGGPQAAPQPPPAEQATEIAEPAQEPVAPAAEEKPSPAPRPAAGLTPTPDGKWRVQLGALDSMEIARSHWRQVQRAIPDLAAFEPSFERHGPYVRVRTGPFASRAEAERICAAAQAAGKGCFALTR